jgi:hypothetical protein
LNWLHVSEEDSLTSPHTQAIRGYILRAQGGYSLVDGRNVLPVDAEQCIASLEASDVCGPSCP